MSILSSINCALDVLADVILGPDIGNRPDCVLKKILLSNDGLLSKSLIESNLADGLVELIENDQEQALFEALLFVVQVCEIGYPCAIIDPLNRASDLLRESALNLRNSVLVKGLSLKESIASCKLLLGSGVYLVLFCDLLEAFHEEEESLQRLFTNYIEELAREAHKTKALVVVINHEGLSRNWILDTLELYCVAQIEPNKRSLKPN